MKLIFFQKKKKINFLFCYTYLLNSKCYQYDNSIVPNSLMFHHN